MKASPFFLLALFCAGSAVLPTGCGSDDEQLCSPGDTRACLGPARCEGAQRCAADGNAYGACECGGDAGKGGTGGADSGTGGSGATDAAGGDAAGGDAGGGDAAGGSSGGGADGGPCDPVTGGGCPADQKCGWLIDQVMPTGHTGCQPVLGNQAPGESCSRNDTVNSDDCAPGVYCDGNECTKVCGKMVDCGQGFECLETNIHTDRPDIGLCFDTCDPVAQDCSEATDACYIGLCGREGTASSDCTAVGGLECIRGSECLPISPTEFRCLRYCDLQALPCVSGETCTPFADLIGGSLPYAACVPNP